jgi:hypothetical protein
MCEESRVREVLARYVRAAGAAVDSEWRLMSRFVGG